MANFVYSFDTGLYDTTNHSEDGYPWKSGPAPGNSDNLGYPAGHHGHSLSADGKGIYYAPARLTYNGHSGTVFSPLSDMNGGVQYLTGGDLGSHANNKGATGQVVGLLYNYIPSASATTGTDKYYIFRLPTFGTDHTTHTANWHFPVMRFSAAYQNNTKVALVTNTNETIIYTIPKTYTLYGIIDPDGWTTAGLSGKDLAVGPNLRRKVALGYV